MTRTPSRKVYMISTQRVNKFVIGLLLLCQSQMSFPLLLSAMNATGILVRYASTFLFHFFLLVQSYFSGSFQTRFASSNIISKQGIQMSLYLTVMQTSRSKSSLQMAQITPSFWSGGSWRIYSIISLSL